MRDKGYHDERPAVLSSPRPTPHQQEILELASIGLSYDEIAARLRVSPRTIRFQLEKIFRVLGVRSRSEAVAIWMDSKRQARRPVDECPYPKPFPNHFMACPAYVARQVADLDEKSRPVAPIWTCQHLAGRRMAKTEYRWYGACVLGDAIGRERWAKQVGPDRLRTLNHLQHDLAPVTGPFAQRLWELKGDQALALKRNEDPGPATQRMEALSDRFIGDIETVLNRRRGLLKQNQLAIDECVDQVRRLIEGVLEQASPAVWDSRFDALMRFPADVWSLLPANSAESIRRS
jgi:DNA-binding CsgD family transcriptional regulator